jgi:hypothetical protein
MVCDCFSFLYFSSQPITLHPMSKQTSWSYGTHSGQDGGSVAMLSDPTVGAAQGDRVPRYALTSSFVFLHYAHPHALVQMIGDRSCNLCKRGFLGVTYQCLSDGYDLCEVCFNKPAPSFSCGSTSSTSLSTSTRVEEKSRVPRPSERGITATTVFFGAPPFFFWSHDGACQTEVAK